MKIVKWSIFGLGVALAVSACGKKKDHQPRSEETQQAPAPASPEENKSSSGLTPLTLGQETSVKGDAVQDENGMFSLSDLFTFKLEKETQLQVRKSLANGNCGSPIGAFAVMKDNEQVASVTIDPDKDYGGVPKEKLPSSLAAGEYMLIPFIFVPQECKGMFYHFYLEEVK